MLRFFNSAKLPLVTMQYTTVHLRDGLTFQDTLDIYRAAICEGSWNPCYLFHVYAINYQEGVNIYSDEKFPGALETAFYPPAQGKEDIDWLAEQIRREVQEVVEMRSSDVFVRAAPSIRRQSLARPLAQILRLQIAKASMYRQPDGIGRVLRAIPGSHVEHREIRIQRDEREGRHVAHCLADSKRSLTRMIDALPCR